MDILNRAYAQLYDLYRSMTPGSRLTAGLLLAVVLLSAGYLGTHPTTSTDYVNLTSGEPIATGDMPAMLAAFGNANLKEADIRGTSIFVPRGKEADYMKALSDAGALPQKFDAAQRTALNSSSWLDVSSQRDTQRMKIATQETLAAAIGKMPGVKRACVLYDSDKPGGFKDKVITALASVEPVGSTQLDKERVNAIRKTVAAAIPGLKPENVTVSDLNGHAWAGNLDEGSREENRYIYLKRTDEQELKAKILNVLRYIPDVTVETTVDLDYKQAACVKPTKHAAVPAKGDRLKATHNKDWRPDEPTPASQQLNTPTVLKNLLNGFSGEQETAEPKEANSLADERPEREITRPTLNRANVTIGVPASYFQKLWREQNPVESDLASKTADGAAIERIRVVKTAEIKRQVAPLLPRIEGVTNAEELITVTPFQEIAAQEPATPTFGQNLLTWASQSWRMLSVIGLALVGLFVLRTFAPAKPNAEIAHPTTLDTRFDGAADDLPSTEVPAPHARRFHAPDSSFQNDLAELVEDDPDAAAHVLRSWIGPVG